MIQKFLHFIGLLALVLVLTACAPAPVQGFQTLFIETGQPTSPNVVKTPPTRTIALVMKTLTNPFFVEMEKGARKAESELGIQLIVKTAAQETSIQQQIEIVDSLVKAKVDAIVIAPGDSKQLIPALKKAQDAGIKVVNVDNQLDPDLSRQLGLVDVPFISVDNDKAAYLSAKTIAAQIKTPTKAVILEGIPEAINAQERLSGARRAFSENPNITLVASESAHWKIDEAHDVTARMFTADPDIGAIFCANDMMALGTVQYLDEQHIQGVWVAGFDNLAESQQSLRDGKISATIDQQAALQGYTGIMDAYKMLNGEKMPPETNVDVMLVTTESIQ